MLDGFVQSIRTEVLPVFEQQPIVPREELAGVELSMKLLSEASREELTGACTALATAYEQWIKERKAELDSDRSLSDELRQTGDEHLRRCRECHRRMVDGISLLEDDAVLRSAF